MDLEAKLNALGAVSEYEKSEVLRYALQESYKDSLFRTCYSLLGYVDITEATHSGIVDILESKNKRKLICVPRGCFKSSIGVVGYCIWSIIRNPNIRILIDSELYTNSTKFLREIKQHLTSNKFMDVFGLWKGDVWNEGEIIVNQRTVYKKEGTVTCGGVGTTKVGQHYDLIIGDDMNSDSNSSTDEGRKKIINHYKYNLSILEQTGEYVLIGTRYSESDLIGWVIANEIGIKDFRDRDDFLRKGLTKKNGVYV